MALGTFGSCWTPLQASEPPGRGRFYLAGGGVLSPGEGQNPWLATPLPIRQCRYAYAEYARKFLKTPRFFIGVQRRTFRDQDPVNIAAAELVGLLHDQLAETGHGGHDLERFLVRIVFCLFADSTGIFEPRDVFVELIETRTSEDGADLGPWLAQLFQMLDTPEGQRPTTLDEDHQRRSIQRTSVHGLLRKDSRRQGELERFQARLGRLTIETQPD